MNQCKEEKLVISSEIRIYAIQQCTRTCKGSGLIFYVCHTTKEVCYKKARNARPETVEVTGQE